MRKTILNFLFIPLTLGFGLCAQAGPITNWSSLANSLLVASQLDNAEQLPIVGAHCAGDRVVAVGEYGSVLLFNTKTEVARQASNVPTRASLTSVHFVDQRHGWAVGHQGVILQTRDGGDTWTLLKSDSSLESLFSVLFLNEKNGLAGGRFATLLRTRDGGQKWDMVRINDDPDAEELHVFDLFTDGKGKIYAASELGSVLVSNDAGATWQSLDTGFGGSLWAGLADPNGTVIVVGMVGAIYRSDDYGDSWQNVTTDTKASFTDIVRMADGTIVAVGQSGVVATSKDNGKSFSLEQREDRAAITAVGCGTQNQPVLFSTSGLVR